MRNAGGVFNLKFCVLSQGYGFTREQSSNALIIHGTVNKALEVLSKLNQQPGECLPVCDRNIQDQIESLCFVIANLSRGQYLTHVYTKLILYTLSLF